MKTLSEGALDGVAQEIFVTGGFVLSRLKSNVIKRVGTVHDELFLNESFLKIKLWPFIF